MKKLLFISISTLLLAISCGSSKPAVKSTVDQDKANFERTFDKETNK